MVRETCCDATQLHVPIHNWVCKRRFGTSTCQRNEAYQKFYSLLEPSKLKFTSANGSIFNLEFSKDGRILACATSKRAILLLDTSCQKQFADISDAHKDCVNFVRFVSSCGFVSCSDDRSAALWDVRSLKKPVRRFEHGHRAWLKNVEYIPPPSDSLLTSGFDNNIKAWKLDGSEGGRSQLVMKVNPLSRMTITPKLYAEDCSYNSISQHVHRQNKNEGTDLKLVVSTTNGHLVIVHNLDVDKLKKQQPSIILKPPLHQNSGVREEERFERAPFIIQRAPNAEEETYDDNCDNTNDDENEKMLPNQIEILPPSSLIPQKYLSANSLSTVTGSNERNPYFAHSGNDNQEERLEVNWEEEEDESTWSINSLVCHPDSLACAVRMSSHVTQQPELTCVVDLANKPSDNDIVRGHGSIGSGDDNSGIWPYRLMQVQSNYSGQRRLIYYTEETSNGPTYIKELDFSPNFGNRGDGSGGRLLCSPFGFGFRLMGFTPTMGEMLDLPSSSSHSSALPSELFELRSVFAHKKPVVVAKFSPTQLTVASACLNGSVVFSHPFQRQL